MLLIVLALLLAAAGGFLGDFLELAGWLILILALSGALLAFFLYMGFRKLKDRLT
jgi:hypothetical protein